MNNYNKQLLEMKSHLLKTDKLQRCFKKHLIHFNGKHTE